MPRNHRRGLRIEPHHKLLRDAGLREVEDSMKIRLPYGDGFQTLDTGGRHNVEVLEAYMNAGGGEWEDAEIRDTIINYEDRDVIVNYEDRDTIINYEDRIVLRAMACPIGSPRLAELARPARSAVVICSDHTRPVPSRKIVPHILAELREGNPGADITLLIATGTHRAPSRAELTQKFGPHIVRDERVEIHDSKDSCRLRRIGRLPSGADLVINRTAADADLLVAEGFIEPHFFAGFSGGRKSVLPGICAYETVLGNHCAAFIADPASRAGVLKGNPIHRDMVAAQRLAKLAYIVNVTIDDKKRVAGAYAGDPDAAHTEGCRALAERCRVAPSRPADIVVTTNGGAPLDQNIYQSVKCMTAAEAAAAPGAVIIALSECADGAGGESFGRMMSGCESPAALLAATERVPMGKTAEDQWQAQILARILSKHTVILVCCAGAREAARSMKLLTAASADEAFELALELYDRRAEASYTPAKGPAITVIPDGVSVIVETKFPRTH